MNKQIDHDRIDTKTLIHWRQVLQIFRRSLRYMYPERQLISTRLGLITAIYLIGLPLPWFLKIIIDHGVSQIPINENGLYPFFMQPFLHVFASLPPLEIALWTLVILGFLHFLTGYSGNTELNANLAEGADVSTQSENKINAGLSAAQGIVGLLDINIAIRLSQKITHHVRSTLFDSMSRLPVTTLNIQRPGDAMFRIMHDSPAVAGIITALIINPFAMFLSVALNLAVLISVYGAIAPELVWIGMSAVAINLFSTAPLAHIFRKASQSSRASASATTNDLEESLRNVKAVQSLGGSEYEQKRFESASRFSFKRSWVLIFIQAVVQWISDHVHLIFQTAGFWILFNGIIDNTLTLGDIPIILRMYSLLYETSMAFGQIWINQQDNAAAARRIFFMIDQNEPEISKKDLPSVKKIEKLQFEKVSFQYPDGRKALENIDLSIESCQLLAIVGPTGSGKTTLGYLIARFIDATTGTISLNGKSNITDLDPNELRKRISFVFQDQHILPGTIEHNLRIGSPNASMGALREACRKANILDFIESMPKGFDSTIGRAGGLLSTGQKQRLSIARGLLRSSDVLILDEPTSALDPETECILMQSITEARKTQIVLVIAHRLSTISQADRILFLENGRIAELGTQTELMAIPNGRFQQFLEASK